MALTRITKGVIKPNENYDTHNINSTGIVTAIGLDINGNADVSGNLSVGGVLTYEDVTSIDSVGIITARTGLVSPYADIDDFVSVGNNIHLGNAGVITATSFVGSGAALTGIDATAIKDPDGNVKIQAQASGAVHTGIATFQDIDVDGHTNLDNVSIAGVSTHSEGIHIPDNKRLDFGGTAGDGDFEIRHTSGNTFIENNTGAFFITQGTSAASNPLTIHGGSELQLKHYYSNGGALFALKSVRGYQTEIYYQGAKKIETTAKGILVGTGVTIETNGQATYTGIITATGADINGDIDVDGHTNLDNVSIAGVTTFSNNVKFDGATAGRDITFIRSSNTLEFATNAIIELGNSGSGDCRLFNNGTDTRIINGTGTLRFESDIHEFKDKDNSTQKFKIDEAGNVRVANTFDCVGVSTFRNNLFAQADLRIAGEIVHISDDDTRIQFPSNDTIAFKTAGSQRLSIDSSGTIAHTNFNGIGLQMSGSGDPTIRVQDTDGTNQFGDFSHNGGDTYINTRNNTSHGEFLIYSQNGSETLNRFKVHSNGDISCGGAADNNIYNDSSGGGLNFKNGGQLVIAKQAVSTADPIIYLNDTGQTTNKFLLFAQDGTEKASIGLAGNHLRFARDGYNETMRITDGGDVSIGGRDQALNNYAAGSTTTKLAVVEQSGGSGYSEVAHFTAGTDTNDTGAIVRITQFNNDRGLYIKSGRGTSDQAKAIFGLRNSAGGEADVMTFNQGGYVNIGSGEHTQTDRMLNVYGGRARVTYLANGNSFEIFSTPSSGASYGMLINAGTSSSDYAYYIRDKSANFLQALQGDGVLRHGNNSATGVAGHGVRIQSDSVGSGYNNAALALRGTGGDFYAITMLGDNGNAWGVLPIFSSGTDYLSFGYYDGPNSSNSGALFRIQEGGNVIAAGSVDSASDIKLKTNVKTIDNALDKVLKLRGAEYDRIDKDNKHEIGVIAQEVEKIIPELVNTSEDPDGGETKTVSYGNMVAVLIEAIKEQNEVINKMKKEIEDLKN